MLDITSWGVTKVMSSHEAQGGGRAGAAGPLRGGPAVAIGSTRYEFRVPVASLRPGSIRLVDGLWIALQPSGEVHVFQDRSDFYPDRPLSWIEEDGQFGEPISSALDGLDGDCRSGPAGQLHRVASRLDGDILLAVPTTNVVSGPGEPAWLENLKSFVK